MGSAAKVLKIIVNALAEGGLDQAKSSLGPFGGAFALTFFKSVYDQSQAWQAEDLQEITDALQSVTSEVIQQELRRHELENNALAVQVASLAQALGAALQQNARDLEGQAEKLDRQGEQVRILDLCLERLQQAGDANQAEIVELRQALLEVKTQIAGDPTERLEIPQPTAKAETIADQLLYFHRWTSTVGRDQEMADLEQFAHDPRPFLWWGINGPGGTGKSRLALEWMFRRKDAGWKVGRLRPQDMADFESGWRPNRPVAMVLDYGYQATSQLPGFIRALTGRLRDRTFPVRLLVLDRAVGNTAWWVANLSRDSATDLAALRGSCFNPAPSAPPRDQEFPAIELQPLRERSDWLAIIREVMVKMGGPAPDLPADAASLDRIAKLTEDGRPLFLAILGIALHEKGVASLESLQQSELLDAIIVRELGMWEKMSRENPHDRLAADIGFVTLCNGLPTKELKQLLPPTAGAPRAEHYLQALKKILDYDEKGSAQPLAPDLLGERYLLTGGCPDCHPNAKIITPFDPMDWMYPAVAANAGGVGQTLTRLRQDFPDNPKTVQWWIRAAACAERIYPDRPQPVWELLAEAGRMMMIETGRGWTENTSPLVGTLFNLARKGTDTAALYAHIMVPLTYLSGEKGRMEEMESWAKQIESLRAGPEFSEDRKLALALAMAATNITGYFGRGKNFSGLEEWGTKIIILQARPEFAKDPEIAEALVSAGTNAIYHYGSDKNFNQLEEWGERIISLQARPEFEKNREIALALAKAGTNAIAKFGSDKRFNQLEEWGERIISLQTRPEFAKDPAIALELAKAGTNAIADYGSDKNFDRLEAWGERIISLQARPEFANDPAIALALAQAGTNAITSYGSDKKFNCLEAWGERIIRLQARPEFAQGREITRVLSIAATNAAIDYININDSEGTHRWLGVCESAHDRFPFDPEILQVCSKSFAATVSRQANPRIAVRLMDLAESSPWVAPHGKETPIGVIASGIILKSPEKWEKAVVARARKISEDINAFVGTVQEIKANDGKASEEQINQLWTKRKYLPNWGKDLRPGLIKAGRFDLIAQSVDDPWNSAEEKASLLQLLDLKKIT